MECPRRRRRGRGGGRRRHRWNGWENGRPLPAISGAFSVEDARDDGCEPRTTWGDARIECVLLLKYVLLLERSLERSFFEKEKMSVQADAFDCELQRIDFALLFPEPKINNQHTRRARLGVLKK